MFIPARTGCQLIPYHLLQEVYLRTAHLLRNHNREGRQRCASNSRDREKLQEACNIVALANDVGLNLQLAVDVIEIAGCLDVVVP